MISTRGRYALRVLIDLAEHAGENYIPLKDVAGRQAISVKYLERIMAELKKAGIIEGTHGKGGGYRLVKSPEEYRVGDILRITEGDLAPVACLSNGSEPCERSEKCRTISMWRKFDEITNDYFNNITISDLMKKSGE
ncbi:MAG: RrF2 family transcriptional regulator [Monoglobales bacterium]